MSKGYNKSYYTYLFTKLITAIQFIWLSYDIKHVENNQICPFSVFLFFDRFWFFNKWFWVIFRVLLRKVDLKTWIAVPYPDFFEGVDLFYRMTWDDLDLYYVQAEW